MTTTRRAMIGVFDEPAMADQAIDALQNGGFRSDQIHSPGHHVSGGLLTSLKNFFRGDDAGTTADDFAEIGISDDEAHYYEKESQAGHTVVVIQADGREQEAMDILHTHGAYNYGMHRGAGQTSSAPTDPGQPHRMQLSEEQLGVNKQRVQTGEVDLRKEVVNEQKTINVPVIHEEAYIERRPATAAMGDDTTPIGEGETLRVPLSEEQVHVSKNTVVTGEVSIGKRVVQETKQVSESVRREEARIEREGKAQVEGDFDSRKP